MKKNIILLSTLLTTGIVYSQVGINTETPKATLDVMSSPVDLTKTDGFIAPRLKGSELKAKDANYAAPQTGAIIYATEALAATDTTAKTINVTTVGYFYFDGSIWQKMTGGLSASNIEPWNKRLTTNQATANTDNIYQQGNVAVGTQNGMGTFHVDASKNNAATGTPTATQILDDIVATTGGRIGIGYNPSDIVIAGRQLDDKITVQANDDLDVNYSLATTNNAQAIVHRNIISNGTIAARTARPNGTSITAFEGHTTTSNANLALGSLVTQQRAGVVLRTGKYTSNGGEIWFGTSGANADGTAATAAGNVYRAIMDEKGNWAFGADPNGDVFYRNPTQRLDLILGGVRIGALGYGTLPSWRTLEAAERPNYISTDPNDRIVVADADGVLKTIASSALISTEPLQVQGTTTKATANNQNVYQMGTVAIGKNQAESGITLDVNGAVRFGDSHTGSAGLNSAILSGSGNESSSDNSISGGSNNKSTGVSSVALGGNNTASGNSSFALGLSNQSNATGSFTMGFGNITSSQYEVAIGRWNAMTTGGTSTSFISTDPAFQIGASATPAAKVNAMTVLKNGNTAIGSHNMKPTLTLEVNGSDGIKVPVGTTAQRPATAAFGTLRYNSTTGLGEMYVNDSNGDGTQGDAGWRSL